MNKLLSVFALFCLISCDNDPGYTICPEESSSVYTLTVDYTTNEFLGGSFVTLPQYTDSLELVCEYDSPSDFGDVTWIDAKTNTKLFAGTIVWMGKGKQTFPEKMNTPSSYIKLDHSTQSPAFVPIYHDNYQSDNSIEVDYYAIWKSIDSLQVASWVDSSTPAYIYLYQPSVGTGDPADWYWVIFLKFG